MGITEDYCSFEVAKLLKEKGFDKFNTYGWDEQLFDKEHPRNFSISFDNKEHWISCPSQSIAMKWLREKHNLFIQITIDFSDGACPMYDSTAINLATCEKTIITGYNRYSYKEAIEVALKYCLENLI